MKYVNKERAEQLIKNGAILVDMRSPVHFRDGHIDGSLNMPLKNFTNFLVASTNKKCKFVLYGTTTTDIDIVQGINYAIQLGFENIYVTDYQTLK